MELFEVELRTSVEREDTVLFLIYVGELSIAERADLRVVEKHVDESFKSFVELFDCLRSLTVTPCSGGIFVDVPVCTAEL